MKLAVCDTGPLLHLSEIGWLDLLSFVGTVVVPAVVAEELDSHLPGWSSTKPEWIRIDALDSGALIALLRREPGGETVDSLLSDRSNVCIAHALNLCEVYYDLARQAGKKRAKEVVNRLVMASRGYGHRLLAGCRRSQSGSQCVAGGLRLHGAGAQVGRGSRNE